MKDFLSEFNSIAEAFNASDVFLGQAESIIFLPKSGRVKLIQTNGFSWNISRLSTDAWVLQPWNKSLPGRFMLQRVKNDERNSVNI